MNKRPQSKFLKTTTATVLAASVVAVAAPIVSEASTFKDVQPSHPFYDAIKNLSDRGIINGFQDGTFKPGQNVTRGQAAKIIAGVLGLDTTNVTNPNFKDISTTHPYYGAIAALKQAGIIDGYEDGMFRQEANIQRNHVAKIIANALNLTASNVDGLPFTDVRTEYKEAIAALYENNVTTGKTATKFDGSSNVTRGQLAAFVTRAEKVASQAKTITFTVTDYSNGTVTANGAAYSLVTPATKAIFTEANKAALTGATITATVEKGALTKVSNITLNNAGTAETVVVFDAAATIDSLTINADYITVKNVAVIGNATVTAAVLTDVKFDSATIAGDLMIEDAIVGAVASLNNLLANDSQQGPNVNLNNTRIAKIHVKRNNVSIKSDVAIPEVTIAATVTLINFDGTITRLTVESTTTLEVTGNATISQLIVTTAVKLALKIVGTVNALNVNNPAARITVGTGLRINELSIPAGSTVAEIITNYASIASQIIKSLIGGLPSTGGNTGENVTPSPVTPTPGGTTSPNTAAISFTVKAGTTTVDGATIKVYSDASRTKEVLDITKVAAGTYYYSVSKVGYVTSNGSVVMENTNKVVEVNLVPIQEPELVSLTAEVDGQYVAATSTSTPSELLLNVSQNSVTSEIVATFNKAITLPANTEVFIEGDVNSDIPYGTIATSPEDSKRLIITPSGTNGNAGLAGTFTFILKASSNQLTSLVDVDGKEWTIPTIKLTVTP